MKHQIKLWVLRLVIKGLLIVGLLLMIILNPILTYTNKTIHDNYTIFHNKPLDSTLFIKLDQATSILTASEFYNPNLHLDICLNDGSHYPKLMRVIRGQAFAWGFYDKVVLQGNTNLKDNFVELNGYKWNLTQLLAHEMTHCLQFDKLGLWKSNPIANVPNWKWEGYPEYISRQNPDQKNPLENIARFISTDRTKWEIMFADSTIASREYYDSWTLIQYSIDIKKMTYKQILADSASEQTVRQEINKWLEEQKNIEN